MGIIEENLRNLQDMLRNQGWRIKWIPWQEPGKPEYVFNTHLTSIMALCGLALFVIPMSWILWYNESAKPILKELFIIAGIGFIILVISRLVASRLKEKDWIKINALCLDRDVQGGPVKINDTKAIVFNFRLLCSFEYKGKKYTVTPENSQLFSFNSAEAANQYLNERIHPDGSCILWIDPKNPLHAVFHEKQTIA